jgi:uncharacterized protein YdhG (YjbR/CyaY superfamily)
MRPDQSTPKTIDEYVAGFPAEVQERLQAIRMTIHAAAPDAQETISYQMPTFALKGNLVHFAAFKNHIGFYPAPTGIEEFQVELAAYAGGKGSVKFPLDRPIPLRPDHQDRAVQGEREPGKGTGQGEQEGAMTAAPCRLDGSVVNRHGRPVCMTCV